MKPVLGWIARLLSDTLARTIAAILSGVVLAIGYAAVAHGLSAFLLQQVSVSVLVLLIIALFATVGALIPAVRLWELTSAHRRGTKGISPQHQRLDAAAAALRRYLATVEAGPNITYTNDAQKFTADVLAAFDDWATSLRPFISAAEYQQVRDLRDEISGRSLLQSRPHAKVWLEKLKDLTHSALTGRR